MGDSHVVFTAPTGSALVMTVCRPCQCASRGPKCAARQAGPAHLPWAQTCPGTGRGPREEGSPFPSVGRVCLSADSADPGCGQHGGQNAELHLEGGD